MADLRTLGSVIYTAVRPLLSATAWVANWNAGGFKLTNLGEPTEVTDAARKNEVDIVGFAAADALEAAETAATAATAAQAAATSAVEDAATALAAATSSVQTNRAITAGDGLTGGGTLASDRSFAVDFGTGPTQVRPANDNAYTNARTPTAHAESHEDGGSDELDVTGLAGVLAQPQRSGTIVATAGDLAVGAIADGEALVRSGSSVVGAALPAASDAVPTTITGPGTPSAPGDSADFSRANHSHSHGVQGGGVAHVLASTGVHGFMAHQESTKLAGIAEGADNTVTALAAASAAISVNGQRVTSAADPVGDQDVATKAYVDSLATDADITAVTAGAGLSGGGSAGDVSLAVVYGATAGTAAEGNDARLSNARTPTAHAASHENGGSDEISVAGLGGVLADAQKADVIVSTTADLTVGTITDGQMLVRSGTTVVSAAIPTGDITAVVAGTGLTGGGESGSVTINASVGTSSGTLAAGDDSRFTDDRTASGLRSATTVVTVSSATAPTNGQVLTATSGTAATWQTPSSGAATQIQESSGPTVLSVSSIADGQLIRRNGTSAEGISQSSLTLSGSQITSGTVPVERLISSLPSQSLRLNDAGTAIEGFWGDNDTIRSMRSTDVGLNTTPTTVFTFSLPAAGMYSIDGNFLAQSGNLANNSIVTFYFAHPNATSCAIGWSQSNAVSTSNGYGFGTDFATALPAIAYAASQDSVYAAVRCWGDFTVSAGGTLTITAAINGDTATCKAGTYLRVRRAA